MKTLTITFNVLLFLIFIAEPSTANSAQSTPEAVVARFQGSLLGVMREADSLGTSGRYARLEPPIKRAFHLPLMVKIATRPYWKTATKSQRRDLVSAFKRMNISTLATLFNDYDGEVFEAIGRKPGPQGTVLVETRLRSPDGGAHDLAYVLKQFKDRWKIVDIIIDRGISELTVRRSEYRQVLRRGGVNGLIRLLNAKADELIAQ